ncbi:hypothetical protein [Erwinia phage Snitter]|nr:hypothetical protein [Erwinia phage Snitter]
MIKMKCTWSKNKSRWTQGQEYTAQVGGSFDGAMQIDSNDQGMWEIQSGEVYSGNSGDVWYYTKSVHPSASFSTVE